MDEELRERIRVEGEKHALYNAIQHDGDAQVGAVMGPLLGENPEFREFGDELPELLAPVIDEVNALPPNAQRAQLESMAPDLLASLEEPAERDEHALPDLPEADETDEIRMRLAPNPNGPWHIGHARMPAVIGTYKDRYNGWFACRFDDTDPATKRPQLSAYDAILTDIHYLGFEPDQVLRASDRLEIYYDYAHDLIDHGGAYTCSCTGEEFSELKNNGIPCDHRDKAPGDTREEFDQMIDGDYGPGEMVLRIRTDIEHPNPAVRDWVAFRVLDTQHPRDAAADYRCWPTLDFQSAIDDYLLDISHIIRGIDLQDSARRQQFIYEDFDWSYPTVIHWGHVQVDEYDITLSTSTIRELIDSGELDGWDDPRAPTIASLRRRGIRGKAIVAAMIELGTSTSNVDLAMSSIYARNRELIDGEADRLFFIRDGREIPVIGGPAAGQVPVHPDHPDRGVRELAVGEAVLIEPEDLPANGKRVWLKGYGCVRHTRNAFEWTGDSIKAVREDGVDVIHWVPADENRGLRLRTPTGDVTGHAERTVAAYETDSIVQFERVGFARIDEQNRETVAYYAHA